MRNERESRYTCECDRKQTRVYDKPRKIENSGIISRIQLITNTPEGARCHGILMLYSTQKVNIAAMCLSGQNRIP